MKKLVTLILSLVMGLSLTVPCFAAGSTENVALRLVATMETEPTQQHHNDGEQLPNAERLTRDTPPHLSDVKRPARPTDDDGSKPTPTLATPVPAPQPKARFLADSIILNAEGDEVTEVAIGETYSLVTTIRASLTGEEVVSLDARNLRIGLSDYAISCGFKAELYLESGARFLVVHDKESGVAIGSGRIETNIAGANRAIVNYVKNSAELITYSGKIIALDDAEFLTRDGVLIGSRAADGILLTEDVATVSLKFTVEEYESLPMVNDMNGNPLPKTQSHTTTSNRATATSVDSEKTQTSSVDKEPEVSPTPYEDDLYSKEYFAEQRLKLIEAKANDTQKAVSWLFIATAMSLLGCVILAVCLAGLNNKVNTLSGYIDGMEKSIFEPREQDGEHQECPRRYGDFFTEKQNSDEGNAEGEYDTEHVCKVPDEEIDWLNKTQEEILGSEADDSDK